MTALARTLLRVVGVLALVVALAALNFWITGGKLPLPPPPPEPEPEPVLMEVGPKDAPVVIQAFYRGNDDFTKNTLDAFADLAQRSENLVHVCVYNTDTDEGRLRRDAAGLHTDGFTVNGARGFKRPLGEHLQQVDFVEPVFPYGRAWHRTDLRYHVRGLLQRHLGDAAALPDLGSEQRSGELPTGSAQARVKLVAYYPVPEDCVDDTLDALRDIISLRSGLVHLDLSNTCSDEGRVAWGKSDVVCHGIVVDGHQQWRIKEDGKARDVLFSGPMDVDWTRQDLELVLDAEIARAYGPAALAEIGRQYDRPPAELAVPSQESTEAAPHPKGPIAVDRTPTSE